MLSYIYIMAPPKKKYTKKQFSYRSLESTVKKAFIKAKKEGLTLSEKIDELITKYANS